MGKLLFPAVCLLILQSVTRAEEPAADPIAAKITAAKDAYYAERDKAEQALISLLEKKESSAKQTGDLKSLEAVRTELEAFRKEGKLPKLVPLGNYESDMKSSRKKLENVYLAAIKSYTQQDKIEQAKHVKMELDKFQTVPSKATPDEPKQTKKGLTAGMALTGLGGPFPCKMEIVEVKGEEIKGVWTWSKAPPEKDHVIPFTGKFSKDVLSAAAINGSKITMNGTVKGDKLIIRYNGPVINPTLEFALGQ